MVIYKAINKINGKEYVGQTIRNLSERISEHKYAASKRINNLPFGNAIFSYGFDNFIFEEIDEAYSIEELNRKEEFYIDKLNTLVPNGYNLDIGGKNKSTHENTRKKMSESRKGRYVGENSPLFGKKRPEEICKKQSESMLAKYLLGYVQSEESKRKNSEAHMGEKNNFFGKNHTEEAKKKQSEAKKGKKNLKLGLSKRRKVICVENNRIYDSVKSASLDLPISRSGIAMVARGECKQMNGYTFKYI